MPKRENDKKLQKQTRQDPEIQREKNSDAGRKNQEQAEKPQKKEKTDQNKQRKKIGALIGVCAGIAVLTICLIAANSRPATAINDTVETTIRVTQNPEEKSTVAISEKPEKPEAEKPSGTEKPPAKNNDVKNSTESSASAEKKGAEAEVNKQDKKPLSDNIDNTGTEVVTQEPVPASTTPDATEKPVSQSQPEAPQTQPEVPQTQPENPQVTAPAEPLPQETTTEIPPEPTPLPHVHSWETKFRTVHHDAVTEQVKVIDQAAYTEPLYEEKPVYETYSVYVCNICGTDIDDLGEHSDSHINWDTFENPFSYHVEQRQGEQIGTEMVQTGSRTYPEKSHMETRVISAAYDEQVPDGYVCTGCGATK